MEESAQSCNFAIDGTGMVVCTGSASFPRARRNWGSNSGRLGAWDANLEGAVDLAKVSKSLLLQRGAIEGSPLRLGQDELYVESIAV
ncbi:hypothetical protein BGZ95_003061 [Linnemannia exigua]|uniref:Uncharacterized protein n=1 Tax=Linnemannia exigua TaxID=604196 RepID=A0AAD4DIF1_9FUNG|nr:hypothetical protein BGZ95_003061 [Linnemannia exigua]